MVETTVQLSKPQPKEKTSPAATKKPTDVPHVSEVDSDADNIKDPVPDLEDSSSGEDVGRKGSAPESSGSESESQCEDDEIAAHIRSLF